MHTSGVQCGLEFKEQTYASLSNFNLAKELFSFSDLWAPHVSSLVNDTQSVPRVVCDLCYTPLPLCTQEYIQNLFDFYKIQYLEIFGVFYIKIHGFLHSI